MRVAIDLERCHLAGECVYNHPKLFAFGDDGQPHALVERCDSATQQLAARQAAEVCPSGAISIVED